MQVNTNGILSFQVSNTDFSPEFFPLSPSTGTLIAPYWDDVDIRRFGAIFYRFSTSSSLLQRVRDRIEAANFGSVNSFSPTLLFIVTWDRVAEFDRSPVAVEVHNSFLQQVLFCIYSIILLLI